MKKAILLSLAILTSLIAGIGIGRITINTKTVVKYEKGETVTAYVNPEQFNLVSEEKPAFVLDRTKFLLLPFSVPTDTAAIIADYETKRKYSVLVFDDNIKGKLELFPTIQYNHLADLEYSFTPMVKNTIVYKERVWQPFVSGSYSTLEYLGVGGGIFYHNLGFEYQYNLDLRKKPQISLQIDPYYQRGNYHWFSGKYKF